MIDNSTISLLGQRSVEVRDIPRVKSVYSTGFFFFFRHLWGHWYEVILPFSTAALQLGSWESPRDFWRDWSSVSSCNIVLNSEFCEEFSFPEFSAKLSKVLLVLGSFTGTRNRKFHFLGCEVQDWENHLTLLWERLCSICCDNNFLLLDAHESLFWTRVELNQRAFALFSMNWFQFSDQQGFLSDFGRKDRRVCSWAVRNQAFERICRILWRKGSLI
jgi:hypothetical protein